MPFISIIVRSKNEEKWIVSCLEAVFGQSLQNFEVILVDNNSTDRTVEKASAFSVKVVSYNEAIFKPGLAINKGIQHSKGEFIAILSAHCIPVNDQWLSNLIRNLDDPKVAAVYGRQEPLPFTNELDKRDMINLFGLDRKIQHKDPFFHNANSLIRRTDWERIPFDEETLHIEDRIWAKKILETGRTIVYEPEASVYHYHGVNQGRNVRRAKRIVEILEQMHGPNNCCSIQGLDIAAFVPSRGEPRMIGGRPLIEWTIESIKSSNYVQRIIVATDNKQTAAIAQTIGCETIIRPDSLSADVVGLTKVYQFVIERLQADGYVPDLVVLAEEIYPFRPPGIIDRMIEGLLHGGHDSVIAACIEYGSIWRKEDGALIRLDDGFKPSLLKQPLYRGLIGLACVTHPLDIIAGNKIGNKVGLIQVDDPFSQFSARREIDSDFFNVVVSKWKQWCSKISEREKR